uniref:Uncharacterized LOC109522957 n=1 Tax=Hippocampus comes TaxID=109280 RepID=A0A3Q2YXX7_HIPCM
MPFSWIITEPKPRGFISCEILRILPVLCLAEGEVKKADADPNRGPCEIVANRTRTCSVMLNPGPAPSPSPLPAIRDADDSLSSPEALRAAGSPQTGSEDQPIGGKTPPRWQDSTEELKTEATAAPRNLHALNKSHDARVKSFGTPDAAARLMVTFASEQSVTEKSPVGPAKSEMTSPGETRAGATLATNDLQVLNKSDDPQVKTLHTRDLPAEPIGSLACERSTVCPPKSETGPGEADAEATLAANGSRVQNRTAEPVAKTLRAPGVPAELIVSFTSEQSVTGKRPISPVPTKTPPSAKRRRASHCPAAASLTKKQRSLKLLRKHSNGGQEKAKGASFETPGRQKCRKAREDDRLSRRPERKKAASTRDRQRLRKWAEKGRQVRRLTAEALKATEAQPGNGTRHRAVGTERQAPPREKSERWNLKPVKSECGRVLVPHGSGRSAHPAEETINVDGFPSPPPAPEAAGAPEPATRGTAVGSRTASPHRGAVRDLRDPVGSEAADERAGRKATTRQLGVDEKPPNLTAETRLKKSADLASAPDDAAAELGGDSTGPCVEPRGMPDWFEQRGPEGTRVGEAQLEAQGEKAEILCRPPSIYPKWKRVKTLRKHLDISREHFKKTWWMHFQRPSGADDAVKERLRDDSLRKKSPTSNASTDALNLLADLALGADRHQVPSQSDRDVARPPRSDLRKNGLPQNAAGAGQASVLLTPRGQPGPARSASPPAEGAEWARLLFQEHAYSLPPRASLLPGLPGAPFQVSPLSGSTGLLQRPRAPPGVEMPRAADDSEELAENEDRRPSGRGRPRTTALNRDRSFVCRDGSVRVTRQWKEKYDFGRDSRFSSDPKDRTIVRALHGPWDFSLQDTREDMQLIVHMWIGFFYSRSTPRFIDLGSDRDTNPRSADGRSTDGIHPEAAVATKAPAWLQAEGFEEQSERSLSNTSDLSRTSSLDRDSDVLNSPPGASDGFEVPPSDPQVHGAKASDSASSPTELKEQRTFQGNRATILSADIADQARCAPRAVAPSQKENESRIQGETATVLDEPQSGGGVAAADCAQPKSDAGEADLKGGCQTAEAAELTGLRKHERGSPLAEEEPRKETGGRSLRTDLKESPACRDTSVSARERPEAQQIGNPQLTPISCHRSNGHFVKGSDEKPVVRISPAGAGRDLRDRPLALVLDCEHSERGHATEPRRQCFHNQLAPTHVASQATAAVCRSNATAAHATSQGCSASENISLVNLEMAAFRPPGKESPCAATGTLPLSGDEKAAPIAPIHRRPGFVQHQTVKPSGSDLELAQEEQKKVRESHCGVTAPFSFFSGESTKAASRLEEVLRDHARNASPESIRELSTSRRTVLKAGQSGHVVGATGGTGSGGAHEKPSAAIVQSQQQKQLIRRETVKLATEMGLLEEGQDEEVEGIHCGATIHPRGVSPTGARSHPAELVLSATSSPDSPCGRSAFQAEGETSRPDAAGDTRGAGSAEGRDENRRRGRGSHFETFNRSESDVESVKPKDMPCAANFPAPPAGPRSAVEQPVRNRTEVGCLLGTGSLKSVPECSPRRVCVLKAGETSRPLVAEGRRDSGSSPVPSDDRPEVVACSGCQNDISSEGSDPSRVRRWLDTKSSQTNSPIETTNATLGQPSNPSEAKDERAKPTRAASTPRGPPADPSDRSVVTLPIQRRADEDRRDAPTSGTRSRERKYRFYILVTSEDAFFAETKACLEAAGHTAVQPSQFFLGGESSSLLIVIRNEDISAHLPEVPHLLELKKSPEVRFAGIDEPHDVMNLTHQELFLSGGFVMFDGPSLEALSLDKVKRLLEVLQELNKTGKWKWLLHYRDSRRFKENARFTAEAEEKKDLLSRSQETGLCAVLPYHECDAKSRDHPDYLACLVHSQVQNIAARFPVFVTDTRSAEQFEKNGILTATVDSFLMRFST